MCAAAYALMIERIGAAFLGTTNIRGETLVQIPGHLHWFLSGFRGGSFRL